MYRADIVTGVKCVIVKEQEWETKQLLTDLIFTPRLDLQPSEVIVDCCMLRENNVREYMGKTAPDRFYTVQMARL